VINVADYSKSYPCINFGHFAFDGLVRLSAILPAVPNGRSWPPPEIRAMRRPPLIAPTGELPLSTHSRPSTWLDGYGSLQRGTVIRALSVADSSAIAVIGRHADMLPATTATR